MAEQPLGSINAHFSKLEDPRIERRKLYPLLNILVIAICGVISGAEIWVDIELYGNLKKDWLGQFLDLRHGNPGHDTFGRVFRLLKAESFQGMLSGVGAGDQRRNQGASERD